MVVNVHWWHRHPRIRSPLGLTLARWSLTRIVLAYVVLSLLLASLLASVLRAVSKDDVSLLDAVRKTFPAVWTGGAGLLDRDGESSVYYFLAACMTVVGVLLPLFLLGSFVFKLFNRDPLVWRSVVSVEDHEHGPVLDFRYYNGLNTPLVGITTLVIARFQSSVRPNLRANLRLDVLDRDELKGDSYWAYSAPGVPFTFRVPLPGHDTADEVCSAPALSYGGRSFDKAQLEFVVIASGTFTTTGGTFVSTKIFRADRDLLPGRFHDVEVDYDVVPRKWAGWDKFEENGDLYVFAYGSLASADSASRTLGRVLHPTAGPHPAVLRGWRREWNVGADASTHPQRRYVGTDGRDFDGVVASVGLARDLDASCTGAVFRVFPQDLTLLDQRERNYFRAEVTEHVHLDLHGRTGKVYTYVPKDESVQRLNEALADGRAVVRAQYLQVTETALSALETQAIPVQALPSPPCPVVELSLEDSSTRP